MLDKSFIEKFTSLVDLVQFDPFKLLIVVSWDRFVRRRTKFFNFHLDY